MEGVIIALFTIGYLAIALENRLKINKTATALLTGVLCWTLFMLSTPEQDVLESLAYSSFMEAQQSDAAAASPDQPSLFQKFVSYEMGHHLTGIAEILFFLLGAMTIVELIDAHNGFRFITDRIATRDVRKLLWVVCWVTFFLSAILDNLTTTIVMVSLVRKLVSPREVRLTFVGMIIIAANAGGAWTPMGDVTTTMLWIGGQISTGNIIKALFLPSVVCLLIPLSVLTFRLKGKLPSFVQAADHEQVGGGKLMLILGLATLMAVPAYKILTHMPPYSGMLLGLGVIWVVSEVIHPDLDEAIRKRYTAAGALSRIDVPSILFFLGILLAVSCLESMHVLQRFSDNLNASIPNRSIVITLIGLLSAIVDNVPLVAAGMGMYSLDTYPMDHSIWEYLAYCAGTGGSILIIGSAAGVAAMGMEKIDFIWYLRRIGWLAFIGYIAGAGVYLAISG